MVENQSPDLKLVKAVPGFGWSIFFKTFKPSQKHLFEPNRIATRMAHVQTEGQDRYVMGQPLSFYTCRML